MIRMRIPGERNGIGGNGERGLKGDSFGRALVVMQELANSRDHDVIQTAES
jgi:hypothetical protein